MKHLIVTALLFLATLLPAYAYDFEVDGIYYNITGSGTVSVTKATTQGRNYSGDVIIPESVICEGSSYVVTAIGDSAFLNCRITSIVIPKTVTAIGDLSFCNCSITTLTIPNSVTTIGNSAFEDAGLCSVCLPNSVCEVGYFAFSGCYSLQDVTLSNSLTKISYCMFYYCENLTSIDIPNSVISIGESAFGCCFSLTRVGIPGSVTSIDRYAFVDCPLTRVDITDVAAWCEIEFHDNPLTTAQHLYLNGTEVKNLVIPNTASVISSGAFKNCLGLESVEMANSVTCIGDEAFYDCIHLASVQLSDSVTKIGWGAFCGCNALESIDIPNSVTSYIRSATFYDCTALRTVTIGEGVTGIDDNSFRNCTSLDTINFNAISCADFKEYSTPPFDGLNLSVINIGDKVQHIPDYFAGGQTGLTSIAIGDAVESIGMYAFKNCTGLKSLTIGKAATTIKSTAFRGCTALDTLNFNAVSCPDINSVYQPWAASPFYELNFSIINIGEDVQRIPSYFAYQNVSLTDLNIPASLNEVGNCAFYECSNLENVVMADSSLLARVKSYAFYNCTKMKLALTNSCGFNYVEKCAFANCPGLTGDLIINGSVAENAFDGCSGLNSLTIGPRVSWLNSSYSFRGCTSLETLNFNAVSCTDFKDVEEARPFYGLNIRTIHIGDSVQRVPDFFATGFSQLTTLTIGKSVKEFGDSVFCGCTALQTIDFNAVACEDFSVKKSERPFSDLNFSRFNIGDDVLRVPSRLVSGVKATFEMTIGRSVSSIGYSAFDSCPGVVSVSVSRNNPKYDSRNDCNAIIETVSNTLVRGFRCSTVPGTVTAIGDSAFCRSDSLTRIVIPNSVITIGSNAFIFCEDLKDITFGNSLTTIGEKAFFWTGLNRIDLPNSVTSLGKSAFSNCESLTSITLSNGLTTISEDAFYYCLSLLELSIPESVMTICDNAFAGCSRMRALTIPKSVKSIGLGAFCGHIDTLYYNAVSCAMFNNPFSRGGVSTIIIGDSVKDVPSNFAVDQYNLTSLTIGNSVETIGWAAFYNCNKLTTVTIPSSVIKIGGNAFQSCTSLDTLNYNAISCADEEVTNNGPFYRLNITTINVGEGVEYIPARMAHGLKSLKNLNLPSTLKGIGVWTFVGCDSLMTLTIPSSVTSIGENAFACSNAHNFETVYCYIPHPSMVSLGSGAFTASPFTAHNWRTLYVPAGSGEAYRASSEWRYFFPHIVEMEGLTGDVNGDGGIDVSDVTSLIDLLLSGGEIPIGADVNGDGHVDISDVTALIDRLLNGN